MGRKKIQISRITDERNRQVTFNKRKFGVMKKAYELSVLCDCEIALIIFSSSNKLYQYASTDMDKVLLKYTEYNEPHESLTNKNIIEALTKKENKNGILSPESPDAEADYTLTPRTEAKYNKIDEDFQLMMQRNQQITTGTRTNISSGTYSLPVTVPVGGNYVEPGMLPSNAQMAPSNISPRPSSSETESVYPSGSILEISNGYPHSASPLGNSPIRGPSPGLTGHHNKSPHHIIHKQQSPNGSQSGRSSNLRVVIPGTMVNLSDNMSFNEANRQSQSTLNTPVVTLQTPIPGLSSYPTISSFGAQDFSMSSSDVGMSLSSWNTSHQNLGGLSHLAVSNSSPSPSTSPHSIKVKTEPLSPPRVGGGGGGGGVGVGGIGGGNGGNGGGGNGNGNGNGNVNIGGGGGVGGGDHHSLQSNIVGQSQNVSVTTMHNIGGTSTPHGLSHSHQQQIILRSRSDSSEVVTTGNAPSPGCELRQNIASMNHLQDFDSTGIAPKRPRISEGWTT